MLVRIEGLKKEFHLAGRVIEVLKGIDLEIDAGEMVSVEGASGVGKSTFLHVLGTLDRPSSGRIWFEGGDITRLTPAELARFRGTNIGFIFQAHHLLPEFTALENVMMPALIQRVPTVEAKKRAKDLLESVGLSERATHRPGQLSGGEQQRVALARSLIMNPKLLLADEPTGNLDSVTGEGVHKLFFDLNKKMGITILMVTHNRELARQIPRQLRMVDGLISDERIADSPGIGDPKRDATTDLKPAESSEVTG